MNAVADLLLHAAADARTRPTHANLLSQQQFVEVGHACFPPFLATLLHVLSCPLALPILSINEDINDCMEECKHRRQCLRHHTNGRHPRGRHVFKYL